MKDRTLPGIVAFDVRWPRIAGHLFTNADQHFVSSFQSWVRTDELMHSSRGPIDRVPDLQPTTVVPRIANRNDGPNHIMVID